MNKVIAEYKKGDLPKKRYRVEIYKPFVGWYFRSEHRWLFSAKEQARFSQKNLRSSTRIVDTKEAK